MAEEKLYTEEKLKKQLDKMEVIYSMEDFTPIELPSYNDIDEMSQEYYVNAWTITAFKEGAIWMKDKILKK